MSDSNDTVTVTTRNGWLQRLLKSVSGVFVGLILIVVMVGVLFWNEGRAVTTARSLDEGSGMVISVDGTAVDPANEGKLVHVTGTAVVDGVQTDPSFGISAPGIRLERTVEMYQWNEDTKSESRKTLGGGEETVTTYSYSKKWSSAHIDSSNFHTQAGHENPEMQIGAESFQAPEAAFGDYVLRDNILSQVSDGQALPVTDSDKPAVEQALGADHLPVTIAFGKLVLSATPKAPAVGDLRVSYMRIPAGPLSIVAKQSDNSFSPYQTKAGDALQMVESGTVPADQMFAHAVTANTIITWAVRIGGLLLLFLAFALVFAPLSVLADIIPLLGTLVGLGTGLIAFICAITLGSFTIALAWFFYRPLLSLIILVVGGAIAFGGIMLLRARAKAKPALA